MRSNLIQIMCITIAVLLSATACIPGNVKDQMNHQLQDVQQMMADDMFKKALGQIELHKLRHGEYPEKLSDLRFLSRLDSGAFNSGVIYHRLENGYSLDVAPNFVNISGEKTSASMKPYPAEFWEGLGCVHSNLKE